jgi:hypothetical protein
MCKITSSFAIGWLSAALSVGLVTQSYAADAATRCRAVDGSVCSPAACQVSNPLVADVPSGAGTACPISAVGDGPGWG